MGTQRRYHADGRSYAWLVRSSAFINFFYFYCVDADFGPFFIKFSTYFPFTAKLCINGNEWAKRQAAKAGIGFEPLDNGSRLGDVPALQAICQSLGAALIEALPRKWQAILPNPFTADDQVAGYRYELSVLQAEFSLTQMLDAPVAGRIFFEQVLRDNLDIGRPDQISLVFPRRIITGGRRPTPGSSEPASSPTGSPRPCTLTTRTPKSSSTTNWAKPSGPKPPLTRPDFGLSKRLTNLPALRQIGFTANRRLLGVQPSATTPSAARTLHRPDRAHHHARRNPHPRTAVRRPPGARTPAGSAHPPAAAPRVHQPRAAHPHRALLGKTPEDITAGKMTYDLRRLREHGLIPRIPRSRRYQVTDTGLHDALLFTHAHDHLLRAGLAELTDPSPPAPSRLRTAARAYQAAFDDLGRQAHLAA